MEPAVHKLRIEGAGPGAEGNLRAVHAAGCRCRREVAPGGGRRALPAAGPARRRASASSARCCANWTARSCPMAAWPIMPASRWRGCAAISSGRRSRFTNRWSASCAAHREEGVLQEEFVTIRNERFVVPVIAGQRRKIDGVIHAASSSGHTLFVEPLETIDLNNELVRLSEEEMREVHRVLLEMTESPARLRRFDPADAGHHGRAGTDLRQGALRQRFRLRDPAFRRAALSEGCAPSATGRCAAAAAQDAGADFARTHARAPHAADQRPQHRRQDGDAEDRRTAQPDGAVRRCRCPRRRPSSRSSGRCWPISAITNRSRRISARFRRTFRTYARWRWMSRRIRWCCWTNWARLPTRRKAARWVSRWWSISARRERSRWFPRT